MESLLWCFVASLSIGCHGLEFSLIHNAPDASSNRHTCGVLMCVESYTNPNITVSPIDSDSKNLTNQQDTTISSLKVFKVEKPDTYSSNYQDKSRRLIASVNSQQSRLTRVSNGISIDGRLEAGWATLRLQLSKQADCQAVYICESVASTSHGNKLLSSSHNLELLGHSTDQVSEASWTQQVAMQLLAIIQKLDTKLEVLNGAVENLKEDTGIIKTDLNSKSDRLEDKVQNIVGDVKDRLEDKIEHLENRIEDKIQSLERSLEEKLIDKFDSRFSKADKSFETELEKNIFAVTDEMSTVKTNLGQLETKIENSLDGAFKQLSRRLKIWEENEEQLLKNLSLIVGNTCDNTDRISVAVSSGLTSLENSLQEKLDDLSSDIDVNAVQTKAFISQSVHHSNLSFKEELSSTLFDVLTPKNCYKGMMSVLASTPYIVIHPNPNNTLGFPVLCDTFTDGGGWIVIQRRVNGDIDFYRDWKDYKNGFGSMDGDFWLGNEKIHALTSSGTFELRVDLRYQGNSAFAHYDMFSVGDEASNYILDVRHYDGTAGDSLMNKHNGMPFTTRDRDNDKYSQNCAVLYVGAWWYNSCYSSNLNGVWNEGANRGPRWGAFSSVEAVSYTEMKIRRVISPTN